mmetsp:Transcript_35712/g.68502  ORF Transcript_35712/g.68502 Transcript_35712/m.68502 type:complete len:308 (-) Transcript_35712:282-1205(-)|eukprot:CAMPEP_0114251742 /NCGR_PEP_ID=MMETSP0058-20121206/15440_1 /TAXON_ID=36894 /ORGANISM="Pyramimonas parkeae, CCMP726" /LENGTH=307 /DNA_ID=CAMNT_0001365579 /DNA_START=190 /DNA_END=1113 /DNA_ORIENTATION=+
MCACWARIVVLIFLASVFLEARGESADTDSPAADDLKYHQEHESVVNVVEKTGDFLEDNYSLHQALKYDYYMQICESDFHEASTFWEKCWNSSTTNEHRKALNKEVLIDNARLPEVQELCKTNISETIQEFPNVPQENMEFIIHVVNSCNVNIATPGRSWSDTVEDSSPNQQAFMIPPPPEEVCLSWRCRKKKTSWYSALVAYAIMGIVPMLLITYTMVTNYRDSWIITRVCRLLGFPDPPQRMNPGTDNKEDEMSEVTPTVFVGIMMPDGHTVVGAADKENVQETGSDGEDRFESSYDDDLREHVS